VTARTRRTTLKTSAVTVSDEQQRDEFWDLARKAAMALPETTPGTFPVMDHQLSCWFEAVEAVRDMPPLLTAGPARIEAGES
jgi:hypothetical protein